MPDSRLPYGPGLDTMYDIGAALTLNPALPDQDRDSSGFVVSAEARGGCPLVAYQHHAFAFDNFQDCRDLCNAGLLGQFATLPPVTYIEFQYCTKKVPRDRWGYDVKAAFYVKGGVRLGDIEVVVRGVLEGGGRNVLATLETLGRY